MARYKKKSTSKPDQDLRNRRKNANQIIEKGKSAMRSAAKKSTSSIRGTDNVDYDGPNRQAFNAGNYQKSVGQYKKSVVEKEQQKRNARRNNQALNIRNRMNRKKGN